MIIKITPQIEEMARTLCGEKEKSCAKCDSFDLCEFWIESSVLVDAGYRKQSEGQWEIVNGSNGNEKMVFTNCRHQQDLASTFTYCPNCGARMRGAVRK